MTRKLTAACSLMLLSLSTQAGAWSYNTPTTHLHIYGNLDWRHGAIAHPEREDDEALESTLGINTAYGITPDWVLTAQAEGQLGRFNQNPSRRQMTRRWLGTRLFKQLEISYGLSENPFTQLTNYTNIFNAFGGQSYLTRDNIEQQTRIRWNNRNWDLRIAHADNDEARNGYFPVQENQSSASLSYRVQGIGAVIATQIEHNDIRQTDIRHYAGGLNYISPDNSVYAAFTYGQTHYENRWNLHKICYTEAVTGYQTPRWFFGLGYNTQRACAAKTIKGLDAYILAAQYSLSARSVVYAEYLYDHLPNALGNRFALGISFYL